MLYGRHGLNQYFDIFLSSFEPPSPLYVLQVPDGPVACPPDLASGGGTFQPMGFGLGAPMVGLCAAGAVGRENGDRFGAAGGTVRSVRTGRCAREGS